MECGYTVLGKYFLLPAWRGVKPLFRKVLKLEVIGLENIPSSPCIVASNHRSNLDPPVLNAVFPEPLFFLAKEELFKPPLGWILRHMRAIPVRRSASDLETLERVINILKKGCKVGIFPEGTRANPGEFLKPKPGVGLLAIRSGFPVLPVYIHGTDEVLPRGAIFPKFGASVKVVIGKPKVYKGLEPNLKNFRKVALDIMEEIKNLYDSLRKK